MDYKDIHGVEIFATGTWNGDTYAESDLDHIVTAFSKLGFKPPLTPGHLKDAAGIPAIGYVENLYRNGKKLIADFVDLPDSVYNAIKQRLFDTVSSEIYWDLERNGEKYPRALKAVALLGADIPAVDLKPLHETVFQFAAKKEYAFGVLQLQPKEAYAMTPEEIKKLQEDNAKLTTQVKELSQKADGAADKAAVEALKAQLAASDTKVAALQEASKKAEAKAKATIVKLPALRPAFQALYEIADSSTKLAKFSMDGKETDSNAATILDNLTTQINKLADAYFTQETLATDLKEFSNAADEINNLTKEKMAKDGIKNYSDAMKIILIERPDLKQAYAQSTQ